MAPARSWRNTTALIAVAALGLAACGGGDDDTDAVPAAEESSADEPADEPPAATDDADGGAGDETAAVEVSEEEGDSGDGGDSGDDNSSSGGASISSLDDIPPACREALSDFLRDIEPIVGDIDWANASFADMEAIGAEFEARANEFDEVSEVAGCNELDFDDNNSFDLIIEFAEDEAPGTVGFLSFLDEMASTATETLDDTLGGDTSGDGSSSAAFDDCDGAIAYIEQLMDDYDTITDAPLSEIASLGELGLVIMSCTPEQMEYFDSQAVDEFLGG